MFPDAFTVRCAAPQLLDAGFHDACRDVGDSCGSPAAVAQLAACHEDLVRRARLAGDGGLACFPFIR